MKMGTDAFYERTIANHKREEYRNTLQDYWRSSKADLNIWRN